MSGKLILMAENSFCEHFGMWLKIFILFLKPVSQRAGFHRGKKKKEEDEY